MLLKQILRRVIYREKCSSESYIKWLRNQGVTIGEGCTIYDPKSTHIDVQNPGMLEIGDYVRITAGTTILTHDYSLSVLACVEGNIIGSVEKTTLGSNIFIGRNAIILKGVTIGNNVIIGAGSVVSGKIPDNCVAAGNPCRVIRTLDEHYKIRKDKTIVECKKYFNCFIEKYNRVPTKKEMGPFFPLFLERSKEELKKENINIELNGDNSQEILEYFLKTKPYFKDYNDFVCAMKKDL